MLKGHYIPRSFIHSPSISLLPMSNGLSSSVVTIVFPILAVGWAVCAVGWVWELYKSHRRRLNLTSPSIDGLFQVEGRALLRSRTSSLLPTIVATPTTPDMRSLESPAVAMNDHMAINTLILPRTDTDSPLQFVTPAEANNPQFPSLSDANQRPQADVPPDTPTPIPSTNTDAISLVSSSTIPPSYHTRHSSRDLHYPLFQPMSPGSPPQEPPTPPPALIPERRPRQSRVRGPRSRGTSRTLPHFMERSDPPPLPVHPFASPSVAVRAGIGGTMAGGRGAGEHWPQRRQAVDGGVRLAGGPLDNRDGGVVGKQWDYLLSS